MAIVVGRRKRMHTGQILLTCECAEGRTRCMRKQMKTKPTYLSNIIYVLLLLGERRRDVKNRT